MNPFPYSKTHVSPQTYLTTTHAPHTSKHPTYTTQSQGQTAYGSTEKTNEYYQRGTTITTIQTSDTFRTQPNADEMWRAIRDLQCQDKEKSATIKRLSEKVTRLEDRIVSNSSNTTATGFLSEEIKSYCTDLVNSLETKIFGKLSLANLQNKVSQIEIELQKFRGDIFTTIGQVETRLRHQFSELEAKTSEHREEIKKIKKLLEKNDFQVSENEKLRLDSMAQQTHLTRAVQPSRGIFHNENINQPYKDFAKKKIICVYSDSKLYTDNTLKKLEYDLLQENDVECISVFSLDPYRTKVADKLFLFYFLTNGREQAQAINDTASRMSMMCPGKPIYLIILKDPKAVQSSIDLHRVNFSKERIKTHKIFEEGFAKFVLYTDKAATSRNAPHVTEIKQNYESLMGDVKGIISQG